MQPPTAREIVLVVTLLFLLINFSQRGHDVIVPDLNTSNSPSLHENHTTTLDVNLYAPSPRIVWGDGPVPPTKLVAHVPGWTMFDKLYLLNGTLFVVSDTPKQYPETKWMVSTGRRINNEEQDLRLPSEKELRIITTEQAKLLFGYGADRIDGLTWLVNDPSQFITHYYHYCAEIFFGFWRTYTSLDPYISRDGKSNLPPPRRMMFIHLDGDHWRDYASMNQWVLRSVFPSIGFEFSDDWTERASMGRPFVFDRVILADRSAAMMGYNWLRTQRTAANPFALPGSVHWWSPIRNTVINFVNYGLEPVQETPVITYISRQGWGRRMLREEDHEKLVEELRRLHDKYGWEVNVVSMDKLSRMEQFQLAGRTTIMMGVHGNGLTSLLWMKPSSRATVMEFFFPGGFAHDYEWTTRALGMVHYGFWGDKAFTRPNVPQVAYPEGFQGNEIPLDGALVSRIVVERLTLAEELDEA